MSIELKFNEQGLIPAVLQNKTTKEVLMVAYMNQEAFDKTIETGKATFYSRSRQQLWVKGETSGNFMYVDEIKLDCDNDTLLVMAIQVTEPAFIVHLTVISLLSAVMKRIYRM